MTQGLLVQTSPSIEPKMKLNKTLQWGNFQSHGSKNTAETWHITIPKCIFNMSLTKRCPTVQSIQGSRINQWFGSTEDILRIWRCAEWLHLRVVGVGGSGWRSHYYYASFSLTEDNMCTSWFKWTFTLPRGYLPIIGSMQAIVIKLLWPQFDCFFLSQSDVAHLHA